MNVILILSFASVAICGPATESYKDQYCTDPRTMRKHAAYTEWADAYSCTRHRCQPGGRNLAIYTVGCKRVEAPESAIECEEVVEDTNMQFPYCCTRLRCLVVVRGEVWTRVLGQPWEALPAAPWSHMYKMKRPPPADGTFLPNAVKAGPVYELAEPEGHEKVLRASKTTEAPAAPDCNDVVPRSIPAPDIVIALSTNSEQKDDHKVENSRQVPTYLALSDGQHSKHKRIRKTTSPPIPYYDETEHELDAPIDLDEPAASTEKPVELRADGVSEEKFFANPYGVTQKAPKGLHHQVSWTEIPQGQWNEHETGMDTDAKDGTFNQPDFPKEPQPSNLQALVDAIGTRMRDIETVVQRMSEKVHDATPELTSSERRSDGENHKRHKTEAKDHLVKKPSPDAEHYKRFTVRNRSSKYLHTTDGTTEPPLFVEDTNMNGYFSDASNSLLRRSNGPKEPAQTYMAPVENRRKHLSDSSDDAEKKHKKHSHKKKKSKHHKKHHGKDEKRKRFNRLSSAEIEKNVVSLEDSSAIGNK